MGHIRNETLQSSSSDNQTHNNQEAKTLAIINRSSISHRNTFSNSHV